MEKIIVDEPKVEMPKQKDTYRAPRLVTLGTATSLVQGGQSGTAQDAPLQRYWPR